MSNFPKIPPVVSKAIRNLPKTQDVPCTLQLAGCRNMPEFTVLAHLRGKWALGAAQKPHDFFGVYLCDRCHDVLDRRSSHAPEPTDWELLNALHRSQQIMWLHGAILTKEQVR